MKPIKHILIFMTVACQCVTLHAQFEDFNKHMEKTVKTSGEYYYGDGSDASETNAQALAVEEMKLMIDEKLKTDNPGVEKIVFSNSLDKNTGYVKFTSLGRYRMVAFIARKSLMVEKTNATTMTVGAKSNIQPASPTSSTPATKPQHAEQVLKELIPIKKAAEAEQYLNTQKNKGTLMVGRMNTLQAAQNCYFIIIRNGEVADVLDKGTSTIRKGLVAGGQTDYTGVPEGEIYWILIF